MPGILVVPYDEEWPHRFEEERARLEPLLAPWLVDGIHHIGSTAIPGCAAKPWVDMLAGIRDLEEACAAEEPLCALGYEYVPHRPEAHFFRRPEYGVHLTVPGSALWRERLAFRDALRGDAALRDEYAALKHGLATEHDDLSDYTDGKRAFVARVLVSQAIELGPR